MIIDNSIIINNRREIQEGHKVVNKDKVGGNRNIVMKEIIKGMCERKLRRAVLNS
jgi:hypothetical protein